MKNMNLKTVKILLMLTALVTISCVKENEKEPDCDNSGSTSLSANANGCSNNGGEAPPETPLPEPTPVPKPNPNPNPDTKETDQSSFNRPWDKAYTAIVIDAYEGNSIDWDKMATDQRMVGVIHRSSIGLRVDSKYRSRKKTAVERGYLWGAYHLGLPGNTIKQADLFLSLLDDDPNTLMILDLEDTGSGKFMSLAEAEVFMDYIYEKTGRIPTVYANHSTTKKLNTSFKNNPLFQQTKLWYARFTPVVTDYPAGIWPNYFLWQFSSEINCSKTGSCLYNVPGTTSGMDINVFYGTEAELRLRWNND